MTELKLQCLSLTLEGCRSRQRCGFRTNGDLKIKAAQFRNQMRGITFKCQFGETDVQCQIPAELYGLQLFKLTTEQSLKDHKAER